MTHSDRSSGATTSSPGRARSWTPLVYPRSALLPYQRSLFDSSPPPRLDAPLGRKTGNCFFPLHWSVLSAMLRELLILDQTFDPKTLTITTSSMKTDSCFFRKPHDQNGNMILRASRCLGHMNGWEVLCPKALKGPKHQSHKRQFPNKKRGITASRAPSLEGVANVVHMEQDSRNSLDAEELVRSMLSRLLVPHHGKTNEAPAGTEEKEQRQQQQQQKRPPRKVSDADNPGMALVAAAGGRSDLVDASVNLLQPIDQIVGENDASRFVGTSASNGLVVIVEPHANLPSFLEASIVTESRLRETGACICTRLFQSVETSSLSLCLGYRTPQRDRKRVLSAVADHLFDVSHAMFAWEQTELEMRDGTLPEAEVDMRVKEALFDGKALRKIGGFASSSVLPHAISIARLAQRQVSWSDDAATDHGREMLKHHETTSGRMEAGQRRRRTRPRVVHSPGLDDCDSDNNKSKTRKKQKCLHSVAVQKDDKQHEVSVADTTRNGGKEGDAKGGTGDVPKRDTTATRDVRIERSNFDSPWGVLLASQGGKKAVVARDSPAPDSGSTAPATDPLLRQGEMILSARNEKGLVVALDGQNDDFFNQVVALFKSSVQLDLKVVR